VLLKTLKRESREPGHGTSSQPPGHGPGRSRAKHRREREEHLVAMETSRRQSDGLQVEGERRRGVSFFLSFFLSSSPPPLRRDNISCCT